jgi:site-specific DNA-adenine methylase
MRQMSDLRAPFPWFGGKRTVAAEIWSRLGEPVNYVEPFFGSGAVLLARGKPGKTETVNDADRFVSNFWRATQRDPEAVAHYMDWPVNEADLSARHLWLLNEGARRIAA